MEYSAEQDEDYQYYENEVNQNTNSFLDRSTTSILSTSFNQEDNQGHFLNGKSSIRLNKEQKQKLDVLIQSYQCFTSDTAFRQSMEEPSYGRANLGYSEVGQQFWARLINQLYSDVFEQIAITRETIIECFKTQYAPRIFP